MKILKVAAVAALIPVVVACTNRLDSTPPSSGSFEQALHAGYVNLAGMEYAEYDRHDGREFMMRARELSSGTAVMPEEISARNLPADRVSLLTSARKRLMKAFDAGAAQSMPAELAEAQVKFDCWMQEQEENKQPEDIAKCQADFTAAMEKLEYKAPMAAPAPAAEPEEPMVEAAPMPAYVPMPKGMHVLFDFDSAELTGLAPGVVDDVVGVFKDMGATHVVLEAFTDTTGDNGYNVALATRRANAVKMKLVSMGVDPEDITLDVQGEKNAPVKTADETREHRNRRVQFMFVK